MCNLLQVQHIEKLERGDAEDGSIPEERRVVTISWKRLGVVNGLRRASTLSVAGSLSHNQPQCSSSFLGVCLNIRFLNTFDIRRRARSNIPIVCHNCVSS